MSAHINYLEFISINNLFQAWNEFRKGKSKRKDVQVFARSLEDNLFSLQQNLKDKIYSHGGYQSFYVQDPKQRHIHKAAVADRVVHHLLYKFLYQIFDPAFIYDSYSCRLGRGTHKGVDRLVKLLRKASRNNTRVCWALKCDIRKFFHSMDHEILIDLLRKKIKDENILWLLAEVVNSFHSELGKRKGIPLGNLTSQIFANIYLNEFDQFIKHKLKTRYYLRYADDFLILSPDKPELLQYIDILKSFLLDNLDLELHPKKIIARKYTQGIDFLGYVVFPYHCLPRTKIKRRILKRLKMKTAELKTGKISEESFNQTMQSYLGFLLHANSYNLAQKLKNQLWFWFTEYPLINSLKKQ
ncbi:MAG: group II intron reverse transcriptase domain-containing protein [Candidatus Blackburnbacteria bacterium]|nr:group II intron reverse transcriptase domain-containing protein [Candidatus Blackburnbacteria bacterium]